MMSTGAAEAEPRTAPSEHRGPTPALGNSVLFAYLVLALSALVFLATFISYKQASVAIVMRQMEPEGGGMTDGGSTRLPTQLQQQVKELQRRREEGEIAAAALQSAIQSVRQGVEAVRQRQEASSHHDGSPQGGVQGRDGEVDPLHQQQQGQQGQQGKQGLRQQQEQQRQQRQQQQAQQLPGGGTPADASQGLDPYQAQGLLVAPTAAAGEVEQLRAEVQQLREQIETLQQQRGGGGDAGSGGLAPDVRLELQ